MSCRIYECPKCLKWFYVNDIDDDLEKGQYCPNCKEKMIHKHTVGTTMR